MPASVEALGVLLVLLPGFSCAYVVERLAVRQKQSDLDKVIEALLLSFVLYLAVSPFYNYSLPIHWQKSSASLENEYTFKLNWPYLATMASLAFGFGLAYSASLNHDWLLKLLRKARITRRTARSSIWNDAFQDVPTSYVHVQLSGDRSIIGYLRYYSDEPEDGSLFLEDAAWVVSDSGEQLPIDGPGILITKLAGIESVSFLRGQQVQPGQEEPGQEGPSTGS